MDAKKNDISWGVVSILIIIFLLVSLVILIWFVLRIPQDRPEIMLSMLLVISVIAFVGVLSFTAVIFKSLGLDDPTQSLGLPEGSVRAVIALSLILIFMISSLLLYEEVDKHGMSIYNSTGITQEQLNDIPKGEIAFIERDGNVGNETLFNVGRILEKSKTSEDVAKQIITTVSTLVVAVAGFYFGSKAATGVSGGGVCDGAPAISVPVIRSINPTEGKREEDIEFKILGKNFELPKEVKLIRDLIEIQCTDITSNSTMIICKLKIPKDSKGYPGGKWTVVVINSDKGEDRLEDAFTVSDT